MKGNVLQRFKNLKLRVGTAADMKHFLLFVSTFFFFLKALLTKALLNGPGSKTCFEAKPNSTHKSITAFHLRRYIRFSQVCNPGLAFLISTLLTVHNMSVIYQLSRYLCFVITLF